MAVFAASTLLVFVRQLRGRIGFALSIDGDERGEMIS